MKVKVKEQIKSLIGLKGMTLKQLAELITLKTGKNCSSSSLSKKLSRGSISYNEVVDIADYLGFEISFNPKD